MFETESPSTTERLQDILDQHGGDLRGAADALAGLAAIVASNEDAARFASVVTHVIGEEGADRNTAARVNQNKIGPAAPRRSATSTG
ncbi:MAG: hypothetical protein EXQ93_02835 [Alphaproteobacteria bacterium]|nr:hypothetical protein [Alphaproteobacteria bacterium]